MPRSTDPVVTVTDTARPARPRTLPRPGDVAWALNVGSQHLSAAREYEELAVMAEQAGDREAFDSARFWQGVNLHHVGRLREALGALAHVTAREDGNDSRIGHMAVTRYVLVAIDMPLALETIEDAIREIERAESVSGRRRRSRVLLLKARLARARGHLHASVRLALEGDDCATRESACFAMGAYRRDVLHGLITLGRLDEAERALEAWKRATDPYASTRRVLVNVYGSILHRLRGDVATALDLGRAAVEEARASDDVGTLVQAEQALIHAQLCSEDPGAAREAVARLLRLRSCESWAIRFDVLMALGDYHLAMARHAAGLPPVDLAASTPGDADPDPTPAHDGALPAAELRRARRAYRQAFALGVTLDRLLACRHRGPHARARQRRLDALTAVSVHWSSRPTGGRRASGAVAQANG